jgi:hypothetical protein
LNGTKKARKGCSMFKAMLIVFFGIQRIVIAEWVPRDQTVNQQCHLEIAQAREKESSRIMEKRLDFALRQRASLQHFICETVFS